ncbi:hypothetical protein IV203_021685 [Nitzschia inconspicua]|uniref:Uncharacterized protein n=1 Tax=Nitzschia inconspicua TaxID=303405 RepID=A0A9K3PDH8_9STRA|nr:hypothetical protein IV203_022762 [Nitzschia inconspicua]KAG7343677.1 hypothetical protein IV203_021685 [Nitzschia inconspicua]
MFDKGADPNTATKSAEASEILFSTTKDLKRGLELFKGRRGISDKEEMMEGIGPKARVKTGPKQHRPQRIRNSEVGTFDRTVLIGRVGTSWTNDITSCSNNARTEELA